MKHLSVIILHYFQYFASDALRRIMILEKQMMFRMSIRSGFWSIHRPSETVYSTELPGNIEAYLFKEGVLSDVYKNLGVDKNGYTTISSLAEGEQIYFFVNTGNLLNGITREIGRLKETRTACHYNTLCLSSGRWRETGDDRKGRLNRKPGEYHPSIAYTGHCQSRLKHS